MTFEEGTVKESTLAFEGEVVNTCERKDDREDDGSGNRWFQVVMYVNRL